MRRLLAALAGTAALVAGMPVAGATGEVPAFHPYVAYGVGSWPESVAVGDVTGDGLPDVVMTTSYYFDADNDFKLFVFAQEPGGTLAAPLKYATSGVYGDHMGVALGDLDADGDLEAFVATARGIDVFERQDTGRLLLTWTFPVADAWNVLAADVNGDPYVDLVVNHKTGVTVLWGILGDLVTGPTVSTARLDDLEVGDVTGDGRADVAGVLGRTVQVIPQAADGTFGPAASYATGGVSPWDYANGLAVADFTGDGRQDVAVSGGGNKPNSWVSLMPQTADGLLGTPILLSSYDIPEPAAAADMNGDGLADLVTLHGGWNRAGVYLQGSGGLGAENLYTIPYASHYNDQGLALGDVTSDGLPDVVVADYNSGLVVLRSAGAGADVTPPDTYIDSGPSGAQSTTTATFTFRSTEPASTFECSLDQGPYAACASPHTVSGLKAGSHVLRVRAIDAAGNVDASPAAKSWTVDGPQTTITNGPTGTVRSTSGTFSFSSDPVAASFECQLDQAPWATCTSPHTVSGLAYASTHTFRVRGVSAEGLVDSTPASRTWSVAPAADLSVGLTDAPDPVKKGATLTYTATVRNHGPQSADAPATLTLGLSSAVQLSSVTTTAGTCTASGSPATVRCDFGAMASGASATVTVKAKVNANNGTTMTATAVVTAPSWDPVGANDSASASTRVGSR